MAKLRKPLVEKGCGGFNSSAEPAGTRWNRRHQTLMICEKVVSDHDDMMVKALSWALRELSKSDKKAVEEFILKNEIRLAGRVIREVTHKLVTGKKN